MREEHHRNMIVKVSFEGCKIDFNQGMCYNYKSCMESRGHSFPCVTLSVIKAVMVGSMCVCQLHSHRKRWLDGLQLEEDPASILWAYRPNLTLRHLKQQLSTEHAQCLHRSVDMNTEHVSDYICLPWTSFKCTETVTAKWNILQLGEAFVCQPCSDLWRSGWHAQGRGTPHLLGTPRLLRKRR